MKFKDFYLVFFIVILVIEILSADTIPGPTRNMLRVGLSNPIIFSSKQLRVTVNSVSNVGDIVGDEMDKPQFKAVTMPENRKNTHFFLQLEVLIENLYTGMLNFETKSIMLKDGEKLLEPVCMCSKVRDKKICGFAKTSLNGSSSGSGNKESMFLIFIAPNGLEEFNFQIQSLEAWSPF